MPSDRKRSAVWALFTEDGKTKSAKCDKCGKQYSKPATETLRYHLLHAHFIKVPKGRPTRKGDHDDDVDDPPPAQGANQPVQAEESAAGSAATTGSATRKPANAATSPRGSVPSSFVGPIEKCLSSASVFARGGVPEKHATDALVYMITHDDLPLSTTEKDGFKMFVKALQPLYKPPTEPTLTKSLEAKYEDLRAHYGRRIQAADHLNLTADLWTHESTMRSYLGLTVHFREGQAAIGLAMSKAPSELEAREVLVALENEEDAEAVLEDVPDADAPDDDGSPLVDLRPLLMKGIHSFQPSHPVTLNLQQKLLSEVNTRFSGIEYLRPYAAATILDPRYKKYVFEHPQAVAMIVRYLRSDLQLKTPDDEASYLKRTTDRHDQRDYAATESKNDPRHHEAYDSRHGTNTVW
ncbi:hypothetical protein HPB49_026029 [Dermacentor silvarum]|nr:hypothetical protein HPB49_026029 [Dermacentor silvarum]